jgi:hypothetical protein
MNLPNATLAIVERHKIADYLLNPAHPDNGGKARFLTAMGFALHDWQILAAALRQLAVNTPVAARIESSHDRKYVQDGLLQTPCGKMPIVRAVWIVDRGSETPRLVTAYPQDDSETP